MRTIVSTCAIVAALSAPAAHAAPVVRPRMLVAARDPFSGLPALRARYAAGVPHAREPGLLGRPVPLRGNDESLHPPGLQPC